MKAVTARLKAGSGSLLRDKAGERALCLHERTFDGQRTSKRLCREMRDKAGAHPIVEGGVL